jgi:hypothetical protein
LQQLSRDELIREYDEVARRTDIESLAFIRDVIFERDYAEQARQIRTLTWWITGLTVANTAAVIIALVLAR